MQCNGNSSRSSNEKKGPVGSLLTDSKRASDEESKLVKTTTESEEKSSLGFISRTSEFSHGTFTGTSVAAVLPSEETRTTSQSESFISSFPAFSKPKEANNSPPLFSLSSKVADEFPPLPDESTKRTETEPGSSSRLVVDRAPHQLLLLCFFNILI